MPSPNVSDNEAPPANHQKPTTPRRSPAVKRPPNATPKRKVSANKAGTPNSAPAHVKFGTKKPEPTLLGDFLLGRPSVNRSRRKSLDVVKAKMKQSAVNKLQPPGGVNDRVKQWQKASAAAIVEDTLSPASEPDDIFVEIEDESVTGQDRRRIKFRKLHTPRPGRRKSSEKEDSPIAQKSAVSPKKRIVSDDHWMKKEKKTSPQTPKVTANHFHKDATLPKDFLKTNSANPTLEKKIEDWAKRTTNDEPSHKEKRSHNMPKNLSTNDGIRISPSRANFIEDGIRVAPSKEKSTCDGIREKPVPKDKTPRVSENGTEEHNTPARKSVKHSRPSLDINKTRKTGVRSREADGNEEKPEPCTTPSHLPRCKNRYRKTVSPESLADIPVGYSAFSVLDIPVGGDASAMRPTKQQRHPSLSAVPKVLKKVYTEGMKIVHDKIDPPRVGINQPPSIESWLKGTSDPFVDRVPIPESVADMEKPKLRRRSYEKEEEYVVQDILRNENDGRGSRERRRRRVHTPQHLYDDAASSREDSETSLGSRKSSGRKINEDITPPLSPIGLKRSPATRITSSSKPSKKTPFRDLLAIPFSGESHLYTPANPLSLQVDSSKARDITQESRSCEVSGTRNSKGLHPNIDDDSQGNPLWRSPRITEVLKFDKPEVPATNPHNVSCRREVSTTRQHRLSTTASIDTFKSSSSFTETSSELSQTTVTQTTVTQRTSNTSNTGGTESSISCQRSTHSGLKRRLTKHSDLLSVLSLPGASGPGRTKSIKSARSVRTTRGDLATATIPGLLRELAEDEVKYMRELKTLVDGVIPVLLTCVLSKSESAIAAGLFDPASCGHSDASITKPIVDMGIALERLKSLHKRIPLQDPDLLVHWAAGAHKVYEDYLTAWRMGFQNVIVNLAPASQSNSTEDQSLLDGMPRNEDGDVVNENGERVDVAFLLKRPLVRVKYLAKVIKGVYALKPREQTAKLDEDFRDLLAKTRRRTKEEEARLVDQAANNMDATRARDPKTLAPMEGVTIDRTRQVSAKDFFDFGLPHSSGQRIDCRVEVLLRDKPHDESDPGDVLICEVDLLSRWLLFPPIELGCISARPGDTRGELVVMIRGSQGSQEWRELFLLTSSDEETAFEWMQMLGQTPKPPDLQRIHVHSASALSTLPPIPSTESLASGQGTLMSSGTPSSGDTDVPIGERRRNERPCPSSSNVRQQRASDTAGSPSTPRYDSHLVEESTSSSSGPRDLNDAMERAGKLSGSAVQRTRAKKHHSSHESESPMAPRSNGPVNGKHIDPACTPKGASPSGRSSSQANPEDSGPSSPHPRTPVLPSTTLPFTPKQCETSQSGTQEVRQSSSLKESMRPDDLLMDLPSSLSKNQSPSRDEGAPPPPPHKSPTSAALKNLPPLATTPTSMSKNRRTSSPLKHEYQPSDASGTSPASEDSDAGEFGDSSDSSEEEELEAVDISMPLPGPGGYGKKVSPAASFYSLPSGSLAPSNSASQAPYRGIPTQPNVETTRLVAAISCWSHKGRWVDLHPEDCSIVVGPGLIEAFALNAFHSSRPEGNDFMVSSGSSDMNTDTDSDAQRPLVAMELTPIVPLRQSNAIDIEIRSPPTARSSVKCTHTIRFRSRTLQECSALYAAIHRARMENPVYKKLEQERIINSYGGQSYQAAVGSNRRRSWFGRGKSYRASTRAPSVTVSENSINSFASAIARVRNMGGVGGFNIAKSTVSTTQGGPAGTSSGTTSLYTRSTGSTTSRTTPPRTPTSPSIAMTGTSNVASLGSSNLQIRLYLLETSSKWNELGNALLTVTHPPRGMRQASSLYHGIEKRIIVTKKHSAKRTLGKRMSVSTSQKDEDPGDAQVILDVVLGGQCFSRLGVVGIAMNVWEDIVGDNGEVGMAAALGGVSGRTRKWMFQCASAAEATWIFALVGGGGR